MVLRRSPAFRVVGTADNGDAVELVSDLRQPDDRGAGRGHAQHAVTREIKLSASRW